ncbi:TatD family hydrolase [Candidatus Uhrbacteria bacterium]|nr:TatD family hydrolase [Candidatus Uhrbacteria bacterium]
MSFQYIDSHCHVHFRAYDNDRDEVMDRARRAGIGLITVGTDQATSGAAAALAEREDGVWATVGLHPHHLFDWYHDQNEEPELTVESFDPERYRSLAGHPKVVAIGEVGLDFFRIPAKAKAEEVRLRQRETFRAQLDLADELQLPVVIHCRDAHAEVRQILQQYLDQGKLSRRGVIHCFTGTAAEAEAYLPLGFYVSFSGIITFPPRKSEKNTLAEAVEKVPLDRLLVETDAPYLAPAPHRGERNEPLFVQFTVQRMAEIKKVNLLDIIAVTRTNTRKLFQIE